MKARLLTGFCYVVVLIGFFCLKIFVNDFLFDLLILAFALGGTFEMLRVFKEKLIPAQRITVMIFAAASLTLYGVLDFLCVQFALINKAVVYELTGFVFIAGIATLAGILVSQHNRTSLEGTGYAVLSYVYPNAFLLVLMACNHLAEHSDAAILIIFFVCPVADSLAFVFGKLFGKKLPAKMSPVVSPNKTVIGGLGGLFGGAVGAVAAYFINFGLCVPLELGSFASVTFPWWELAVYISLGIVAAAFAQFGDLVESAVKRKLGIKDMGKLLPGHGGVMDRIDSTLYASLIVFIVFLFRIILRF